MTCSTGLLLTCCRYVTGYTYCAGLLESVMVQGCRNVLGVPSGLMALDSVAWMEEPPPFSGRK